MRSLIRCAALGGVFGLAACGTTGGGSSVGPSADASVGGDARDPGEPGDQDGPGDGADGASLLGDAGHGDTTSADAASLDASVVDGASSAPGTKRGLAYGYDSDSDLTALSAGVGWWYNWSPTPDGTLTKNFTDGVEFVPMIWGGTFNTQTLATQVPPGAKYLLTFNEPNFGPPQSNLTPAQAAALWPQIQAFAQARGMKIVSPAVNYCGSPCNDTDPFDWLTKFFAACSGCQVDYVAMHWYACSKAALTSTVSKYETTFNKPLWVTEFSCLDTASDVTNAFELSYMKDAVAALEADPMVFRYAWFTGRSTGSPPISLLADAGVLTPLGAQYVSLPR